MTRHGLRAALRDVRGLTFVEMLVAATIFLIVAMGIGSLYTFAARAFDYGSSQSYVQRQGTQIQERIARLALNAVAVQTVDCGGNTTANRSLMVLTGPVAGDTSTPGLDVQTGGSTVCIYQTPGTADTDADLRLCQIASFTVGTACTAGTDRSLLTLTGSEVAARLGAPLVVRNSNFRRVTCIPPGGGCSPNFVGRSVVTPLVDVSFDLTDNTIPNPQAASYVGMRFGFSLAVRN